MPCLYPQQQDGNHAQRQQHLQRGGGVHRHAGALDHTHAQGEHGDEPQPQPKQSHVIYNCTNNASWYR